MYTTDNVTLNGTTSKIDFKTTYKILTAVLADTATKLATIRTISGTDFDGTANIVIKYEGLNNKPIILLPHVHTHTHTHTHVYIYIYTYTYIYKYVHIHIHILPPPFRRFTEGDWSLRQMRP